MVTITCVPDRELWHYNVPPRWSMSFEEAEIGLEEMAEQLALIAKHIGFMPSQIAEIIHPDFTEFWVDHVNPQEKTDGENGSD